jgi:hypothetical protein
LERKADLDVLSNSIFFLSGLLHNRYNKKVIILIDEYDAPITAGYNKGYYDKVVSFMRSLLTDACKDNINLNFALLTGILRVAKESIFSGLNNLAVHTILSESYQDAFGFTEPEVKLLLENQELQCSFESVKEWYNGYLFGNATIYNPWSILQCAANNGKLAPYWVNTSDNALIKTLLIRSGPKTKEELERLLTGNIVEKQLTEATIFPGIERNSQALWSLLAFTGYLSVAETKRVGDVDIYSLTIPNKEINQLYAGMISETFTEIIDTGKAEDLLRALTTGDCESFAFLLQEFVESSISMFDFTKEPENSYHLFVLGMLIYLSDRYEVKSNRESGFGRYDIMVIPRDTTKLGIIIEFKKVMPKETIEEAAQRAIEQIQQKNYAREMRDRGITKILQLGIACRGKEIFVQDVAIR